MIRYIEMEAAGRAANDIRLPKRNEVTGTERINAWIVLYREHYQAIMKEAIDGGGNVVVFT